MSYTPYTRDSSGSVIIGPMSSNDASSYDKEMNGPKAIPFKPFTDNSIKSGNNIFRANSAASPGDFKALCVYFSGWQVQDDMPRWPGITKRSSPLNVAYYPYVINWNGNGGTVKEKTTQITFDKLPLNIGTYNVPTRGSWVFKGWSTSESGAVKYAYDFKTPKNSDSILWKDFPTKTVGDASVPYTTEPEDCVGSGTITLFAIWQQPNCTITFKNYSDQTKDGSITMKYGDKYTNISIPKKTGYIFGGYYTEVNGGGIQRYSSKGVVNPAYDYYGDHGETATTLTLHAKWTAITYKIRFSNPVGTSSAVERTYTYDVSATLPKVADLGYSYLGYSFNYWEYGKSHFSDGQSIRNLTSENGKVLSFNASWKANPYTITYRTNVGYVLDPSTTVSAMGLTILGQTTSSSTVKFNSLFTAPNCTARVPGLTFYCWIDPVTNQKYFTGEKYVNGARLVSGTLVAQSFTLYPMFKMLPYVLTLTEGTIKANATSYKFVSPTKITNSKIKLVCNGTTLTLGTHYKYSQTLVDGLYSVTITILVTQSSEIAVYINGDNGNKVWHKGIFYTLVSINNGTYKWLPTDTFVHSGEEFKKL